MRKKQMDGKQQGGFALFLTVIFVAIGCLAVAGTLNWAQTNARLTDRNNEYITSVCAAEAAIETVRTQMGYLYANGVSEPSIYNRTESLGRNLPNPNDNRAWADYTFTDPTQPGVSATIVRKSGTNVPFASDSYKGLTSYASTYQIIANVQNTNSQYKIPVCVGAEILLGTTPLFQYAIFYQEDMEIHPGSAMTVNGLVHGNADIYLSSSASLTMGDVVSASGKIINPGGKTGDPTDRTREHSATSSVADNPFQGGANALNLPIGTNQMAVAGSSSNNIHAVLEVPPPDEPYAYGEVGTNRYYNKADLIIRVMDRRRQ